jgi:hypothetical protein
LEFDIHIYGLLHLLLNVFLPVLFLTLHMALRKDTE